MTQIQFPDFMAITVGLVVYLVGEAINNRVAPLRYFNIPDPVTGGLLFALLTWGLYKSGIAEIGFDTHTRDLLLLIFFTGIGLNARLSDLIKGGKPLAILIGVTAVLLVLQMVVGGIGAWVSGLPMGMGAVLGSTALLGGHGTVIAWTPELRARGLDAAPEVGIAMATLALVVASVIGGPMAGSLIKRFKLVSTETDLGGVGVTEGYATGEITRKALMRTLLTVFLCMIAGFGVQRVIAGFGLNLPLFVPCLLVGMVVGNLLSLAPFIAPVTHTPALSLVSEFALGVFLAVSLMSLRLWQLGGYAGTILIVLAVQTLIAGLVAVLLVFRLLGRDYQAAVIASGYASFVIGATPTAIATMTAVTKRHGACQAAFIVIPLLSALFVDIANALVTQGYLNLLAP